MLLILKVLLHEEIVSYDLRRNADKTILRQVADDILHVHNLACNAEKRRELFNFFCNLQYNFFAAT